MKTFSTSSGLLTASRAATRVDANRVVLGLHTLLAAFIALRGYPATQDGPAHLYGAHIALALRGAGSIYQPFFASNLRPAGNSLFSYFALWLERFGAVEWSARVALFAALMGMPLALMAFTSALRSQTAASAAQRLPEVAATSLACVLAYNYFACRGFFNFILAVPLAFACLAALVALGAPRQESSSRLLLTLAAPCGAVLAALAHPAATAFLLVAASCVLVCPGRWRRGTSLLVLASLCVLALASRIDRDAPSRTIWLNPLVSLPYFVRALGLSLTWAEVLPALALLFFAGWGARRALASPRRWRADWSYAWPGLLGVAMACGYFFVPFEYGGAAGLNERLPIFAVLLLIPYVPLGASLARWLPHAFAAFAVYTAAAHAHFDGRAQQIRDSASAQLIPAGSTVYAASLRLKLGTVSVDLGRHVLADVARRHDLVAGTVFASHPAHVLRALPLAPPVDDGGAVQRFEHLSAKEQAVALADQRARSDSASSKCGAMPGGFAIGSSWQSRCWTARSSATWRRRSALAGSRPRTIRFTFTC